MEERAGERGWTVSAQCEEARTLEKRPGPNQGLCKLDIFIVRVSTVRQSDSEKEKKTYSDKGGEIGYSVF